MSEQRLRDPARLAALADELEIQADAFGIPNSDSSYIRRLREVAAILRALAEQEPVAWRWRIPVERKWVYTTQPPTNFGFGMEEQPLYIHPKEANARNAK